MSFNSFTRLFLHNKVNSSTEASISSFFLNNINFQKFVLHKFIDYLPQSQLNEAQIHKEFEQLENKQSKDTKTTKNNELKVQKLNSNIIPLKFPFLPLNNSTNKLSLLHKLPFDLYCKIKSYNKFNNRIMCNVSKYLNILESKLPIKLNEWIITNKITNNHFLCFSNLEVLDIGIFKLVNENNIYDLLLEPLSKLQKYCKNLKSIKLSQTQQSTLDLTQYNLLKYFVNLNNLEKILIDTNICPIIYFYLFLKNKSLKLRNKLRKIHIGPVKSGEYEKNAFYRVDPTTHFDTKMEKEQNYINYLPQTYYPPKLEELRIPCNIASHYLLKSPKFIHKQLTTFTTWTLGYNEQSTCDLNIIKFISNNLINIKALDLDINVKHKLYNCFNDLNNKQFIINNFYNLIKKLFNNCTKLERFHLWFSNLQNDTILMNQIVNQINDFTDINNTNIKMSYSEQNELIVIKRIN